MYTSTTTTTATLKVITVKYKTSCELNNEIMRYTFEEEFRLDHPETVGETDRHFDLDNYKDWLEAQLIEARKQLALYNVMPRSLTAENGAKALLMGEFFEEIEVRNPLYCGCGDCDMCNDFPDEYEFVTQKVPVSWDTIKSIYAKIVSYYGA